MTKELTDIVEVIPLQWNYLVAKCVLGKYRIHGFYAQPSDSDMTYVVQLNGVAIDNNEWITISGAKQKAFEHYKEKILPTLRLKP